MNECDSFGCLLYAFYSSRYNYKYLTPTESCFFATDARIIIFFIDVKWTLMIECDTFNLKIFDASGVCYFCHRCTDYIFYGC